MRSPTTVAEHKSKIACLDAALIEAKQELTRLRQRRRILCCCGNYHAIKDLDLIITHWYHEPHGCTEGDYWSEGEWNFIGPCGARNRLMFNDFDVPYEERKLMTAEHAFKELYRGLFKSTKNEHDNVHESRVLTRANDYVDHNRGRFELPEKRKK